MFLQGMMCWNATVNCPNTDSINAVFGYKVPPQPPKVKGTIVLFSGGPGTAPSEYADNNSNYAADYYAKGYAVVLLEWASPWEKAYASNTNESTLTAACRPATLMNYISNTFLVADGPSCAQGSSAGSAAIAYAMSWYGASYLKNVELLSGPVLSQIDQGCAYPPKGDVTICPSPQSDHCTTGTAPWGNSPMYVHDDQLYINSWSGLQSCAVPGVTQAEITQWANMSIVDGVASGAAAVFNFPNTTKHGWLCASNVSCSYPNCPNNSAAEGSYWYTALQDTQFSVTGTLQCPGAEGVTEGFDPDSAKYPPPETEGTVIEGDMEQNCQLPQ